MHSQTWKLDSGEEIELELYEITINCKEIRLPVMTNYDDISEMSVIQLRNIYEKYITFMESTFKLNGLSSSCERFDILPYVVIDELNKLSEILYNYLLSIGVRKFMPKYYKSAVNMDPMSSTPPCQYAFEEFKKALDNVDLFLKSRGLTLDRMEL